MKVKVLIESTKVNIFSTFHILRSTYFQNLRYQGQLREAECGYEAEQRQRQEVVAKNPTLIFKHLQFPIPRFQLTKILLATIKNHSSPPRWWKEQVWLSVAPMPLQVILLWLSSFQ